MNRIIWLLERVLLTVFFMFLLLGVAPYFLLQTHWGAKQVSHWLSQTWGYTIRIDHISHSIFRPLDVEFRQVTVEQPADQSPYFTAKHLHITLNAQAPLNLTSLQRVMIDKGHFYFTPHQTMDLPFPLAVKHLQLMHSALSFQSQQNQLTIDNIHGGILNWHTQQAATPVDTTQFRFTMANITLGSWQTGNAFLQGYIKNQTLYLTDVGSDMIRGGLTATIQRAPSGTWLIQSLAMNDLHLQTSQVMDLAQWQAKLADLPDLSIKKMQITQSSLDSTDLHINQFNGTFTNLVRQQGKWRFNQSQMQLMAQDIVYQDAHLTSPDITLMLNPESIDIQQASAYWQKGLIRTQGTYKLANHSLTLDKLLLAKIHYTLPEDPLHTLPNTLFNYVDTLHIDRLVMTPSTLIDITPTFPFEFSQVELNGHDLHFTKTAPNWLTHGQLTLNARRGTLNQIPLKHPSATLIGSPETVTFTHISAMTDPGVIEGQLTLTQQVPTTATFHFTSYDSHADWLNQWYLLNTPLSLSGRYQVHLTGTLQPIKLDGQLSILHPNRVQTHYLVQQGELMAAHPTPPPAAQLEVDN